jgi:large subunit ribosomal protein L21
VVEQGRGPKGIIFKKRRRQNYRRKKGHRQDLTTVRILEIFTDGKAPVLAAKESGEPAGAAGEAKPAKPRAKKPAAEAGAEAPANAAAQAPGAEVTKAKAAKPKAEESAEPKAAAPKKPRAKKAE